MLGLHDLMLQGVDLKDQYADLRRVAAGIEQRLDLLLLLLDGLKKRRHGGLPRLQQFSEERFLRGLQLQDLHDNLQR